MDQGNLIYLAFVNMAKRQVLVSYPPTPLRGTSEMVINGLDEVYEDSLKAQANDNIRKLVLEYHTVYYHVDEAAIGAMIVMIFEDSYPQRLAYSMIQELWKEVLSVTSREWYIRAKPKTLQKRLKTPFYKIFKRYDNAIELDDALRVKVKIENATGNIEDTMTQIIDTCVNLEELQEKSQRLKRKAIVLQGQAVELKQEVGSRMVFTVSYSVAAIIVVALYIALPIILKQNPNTAA